MEAEIVEQLETIVFTQTITAIVSCLALGVAIIFVLVNFKNQKNLWCVLPLLFVGDLYAGDGVDSHATWSVDAEVASVSHTSFQWLDASYIGNLNLIHLSENDSLKYRVYRNPSYLYVLNHYSGSQDTETYLPFSNGRHLLCVTGDANHVKFYLDGALINTADRDSATPSAITTTLKGGGESIAWGFDDRAWTAAEVTAAYNGTLPDDVEAVFHAGYDLGQSNLVDESAWYAGFTVSDAPELDLLPYGSYDSVGVFQRAPPANDGTGGGDYDAGPGPSFDRPSVGVQPDGSCITGYAVFALTGDNGDPLTPVNLTGAGSVCIEVGGDGAGYTVGQGGPAAATFGVYQTEIASYYNPNAGGNCYWNNTPGEPVSVLGGPGEHGCAVVAFQGWELGVVTASGNSFCECLGLANGTPGDADGDGIFDSVDTDDPNCGVIPTPCNDSDGNGVLDEYERPDDLDGDGLENAIDATPRGPNCGVVPACGNDADADGDGIVNRYDPDGDMDGDGIPDGIDATPQGTACPAAGSVCSAGGDADGDGIQNGSDPDGDIDGDGIADAQDATPYGPGCAAAGIACSGAGDFDGDGIRNDAEAAPEGNDVDGDGIPNNEDATPWGGQDCPIGPCGDEGDADGDGIRNDHDDDYDQDGDGIPDDEDVSPRGDDCPLTDFCDPENLPDEVPELDAEGNCVVCRLGEPDDNGVQTEVCESFEWPERYADCDFDGDGCLNGDDPFPCDPERDCSFCAIVIDSFLEELRLAFVESAPWDFDGAGLGDGRRYCIELNLPVVGLISGCVLPERNQGDSFAVAVWFVIDTMQKFMLALVAWRLAKRLMADWRAF